MSGYGERRTATTSGESCEEYYGLGDKRCPSSYAPTGDLMTDIKLIQEQLAHYRNIVNNKQVRSYWFVYFTNLLQEKRGEQSKILAQEEAKETTLPSIYGGQFVPPPQIQLSSETNQILQKIESGQVLIPDWFKNNVNWVKDGSITQDAFVQAYNHQVDAGNIHPPISEPEEPEPDPTITDNMVTQQMINFNIVNGRAVGSIRFVATNNFNPFFYGKNIVNMIQFKDPNDANILTFVKQNNLNFTETERDEVINYDEDMHGNTRATVESFVWSSPITPSAFSKMYSIEISEAEPPKPITSGFMGAGVVGAIAGLVLLGFIIDHKVSK
jgi:hypothetical protein